MRAVKLILAAVVAVLAVVAGAFVFAVIAAAVVVFLLIRWARRRMQPASRGRRRPAAPAHGDVIDVVATEKRETPESLEG